MLKTDPNNKRNTKAYLEKRVKHLEDVERYIVDGLEMAASLGDFQHSISKLSDVSTILEETKIRIQSLISFESVAFFLVEEVSNDFIMKYIDSETYRSYIQNEVDYFIDNGTFAWALREKRPIILTTRDKKGLLLHVMSTTSRVRGICVAILPKDHQPMLNTSLSLLSTVLQNSANAIESFELYRTIREISSNLERIDNYRILFAAAPDGVEVMDALGNILDTNDTQTKLLGYSQEHLLGSHSSAYFSEGNRASFAKNHLSFQEKGSWEGEVELVTAKGDMISVWRKEKAIYDKDQRFIGSIVYNRDITSRKRAEIALCESEEKFSRIFKMSPDTMTISRLSDGVYIDVNDEFTRQTGYDKEEVLGKSPSELQIWGDTSDRDHLLENLFTKEEMQNQEYRFRCKDGIMKTGEMSARVIMIGGDRCILSLVRNITEKLETQRALRESEERFRSVVERSLNGIAIIDDASQFTYVNEEFCNIAGYEKHEIIGRHFTFLLAEESKLFIADRNQRRLRGEDVPSQYEFSFLRKNGEKRLGELRSAMYLDSSNKVKVIIQAIDITDRKQAEEEKQRLEERLNRAGKMEALGTLAGGVAHDLNNVLGVLVGYSELLAEKLRNDSSLKRYTDKILNSSIRGAAIIQDLLTLARRGVTVSEIVEMNSIIFDYLKTLEFETLKSHHPGVKIQTEFEDGLLSIKGSPIHLGKMIMNLVSNATESISDHGVVTIRTENRYLDKPVHGYDEIQEGDYVILSVSDTGSGISASDLGKIFEPFYTKKVMGRSGTGLGLAVVWGTVKDHHGYIDVRSEEDKGSTFTLYFPVTREVPGIVEKTGSPVIYMGKGESILVVDDLKEQCELAMSMLGRLGYRVEAIASGEEAVDYLKNKKADLIILDMIMDPGIDGMETYRRILEINPGQKAVIVSGFSETDRIRKTLEMGAGAFLQKPYILEKIGLTVRKELDRK